MTKRLDQIRKGDTVRLPSGAIVTAAEDAERVVIESWRFPVEGRMPCDHVGGAASDELALAEEWPEAIGVEGL
jgi:hypothetical protein